MGRGIRYFCVGLLFFSMKGVANAQFGPSDNSVIFSTGETVAIQDSSHKFVVRDIIITGNNKTRPKTILRELPFHENEEYPLNQIVEKFYEAKKRLMNTGLFHDVVVSLKSLQGYDVYVSIEVKERWYVFPVPVVKAVDKSFHQWYKEGMSMDHVIYGVNTDLNNFTGRNDKFSVSVINGYVKQVAIQYRGIYLDKNLRWSTNAGVAFGGNKEVNYMTMYNKTVPFKDNDQFVRSYMRSFVELSYRRAIKTRHTFGIAYNYETYADTIFKLNPHFSNRHVLRYPELSYKMTYFDVDFIPYPTKGLATEITVRKKGLNDPMNIWQLNAKESITWPVGHSAYFNLRMVGMLKLPFNQPYNTQQFLGTDDQFLQGYEDYVIDGVAGGYTKATLAKQVINTHLNFSSQKFRSIYNIPFRLYLKAFVNTGYVHNPNPGINDLTNKMLYSYGVGMDIVTFTDFVIKLEWSFNQLGENGVYLHRRNYF
jgi:outer membrane protein assembly factor BamA